MSDPTYTNCEKCSGKTKVGVGPAICEVCRAKTHPIDNVKPDKEWKKDCFNHKWTWSGVPNGLMWCKLCNIDYSKIRHGDVPDLGQAPMYIQGETPKLRPLKKVSR